MASVICVIQTISVGLTRALVEGAFLAPLQTSRYISRTAARIVTKLSVPSRTSILHIVTKCILKGYDMLSANDGRVMSCSAVFGAKNRFRGKSCKAYSFEDTEKQSTHKRCRLIRATKLLSQNFEFFKF